MDGLDFVSILSQVPRSKDWSQLAEWSRRLSMSLTNAATIDRLVDGAVSARDVVSLSRIIYDVAVAVRADGKGHPGLLVESIPDDPVFVAAILRHTLEMIRDVVLEGPKYDAQHDKCLRMAQAVWVAPHSVF